MSGYNSGVILKVCVRGAILNVGFKILSLRSHLEFEMSNHDE